MVKFWEQWIENVEKRGGFATPEHYDQLQLAEQKEREGQINHGRKMREREQKKLYGQRKQDGKTKKDVKTKEGGKSKEDGKTKENGKAKQDEKSRQENDATDDDTTSVSTYNSEEEHQEELA